MKRERCKNCGGEGSRGVFSKPLRNLMFHFPLICLLNLLLVFLKIRLSYCVCVLCATYKILVMGASPLTLSPCLQLQKSSLSMFFSKYEYFMKALPLFER